MLSLLATEVYRIGASGGGADLNLLVENESIVDVQIINAGSGHEAVEISAPSRGGESAIFQALIEDGQIKQIDILDGGSGYKENFSPQIIPSFSRSTLWVFWTIDTICCILFLINFFFELKLSDSKKWYWKTHWVDFVTSIPLPPIHLLLTGTGGLGAIRAGRLLRLIRILRAVRILRMFLFLWRGMDHLSSIMDVKLLKRSLFLWTYSHDLRCSFIHDF